MSVRRSKKKEKKNGSRVGSGVRDASAEGDPGDPSTTGGQRATIGENGR